MYQSRSILKLTIIAVALSVLIHVGFIVFSINKKMTWESYQSVDMVQKVTPVEFMDPEEMPEEMKEMMAPKKNEPISNKTFNTEDKQEYTEKKYDSRTEKSIQEEVEKELREFEAKEFAKYKKENKQEVAVNKEENKTKTNKESEEVKTSSGSFKGSVTAMYELTQRRDEKLPIPAYICKGSGTVKVNITVDREGLVILATIDKRGSEYKETCIGENALTYAKKARFSVSTVAPEHQSGWILYTFISQ
jgi:hypothetical protein